MKEYQSEITNEIIKGVTIGIALIIVFVIAILVMRLILEKKYRFIYKEKTYIYSHNYCFRYYNNFFYIQDSKWRSLLY